MCWLVWASTALMTSSSKMVEARLYTARAKLTEQVSVYWLKCLAGLTSGLLSTGKYFAPFSNLGKIAIFEYVKIGHQSTGLNILQLG